MSGDDYQGWPETPSRREPSRHDPDDEYGRPRHSGRHGRDSEDWTDEQGSYPGVGNYQGDDRYASPAYDRPGGYPDDWSTEQDRYNRSDPDGRTDPGGQVDYFSRPDSYSGRDDYSGRGDYGGAESYGQDPAGGRSGYAGADPDPYRADPYRGTDPYGGANPYGPADPRGAADPRGGARSNGAAPYRGASPAGPDPYADHQPYDDQRGYPSRELYNGREDLGEPVGYGGQDAYAGPAGYDTGSQPRQEDYREDSYGGQPGYELDGDYDAYGRQAGSGPLRAYPADNGYGPADDDPSGWQPQQDGIAAARDRGSDQQQSARPRRDASRYEQGEAGQERPLGGSRRSGRGMEADDDRHSGFFSGFASNDDDHYGRPKRRRRGVSAGLIALVIVIAVLGGIGGVGYHFYSLYKSRHASYSGNGYGTVIITVPQGAGASSIAPELLKRGVIAAIDPWDTFVASKPSSLQPGEFKLHKHMGNAQAWALLLSPKARVNSEVTIPDGLRYSKFLPLLAKESGIPLSQFQAAIKETAKLGLPAYASGNPEGYLFPDTYDVVPGTTTALQILQMAVHQFNTEATLLDLAAGSRQTGFTEAHIVTEASLLEGEVGPAYYAKVARVLDNRLNMGMPLQLDSTVSYVTGDYRYNLSSSELNVKSPYNTFLHTGLPPGPINSPDAKAIEAVLHPAALSNDWTYFVTVNKAGLTLFTNSQTQFLAWGQEAIKNGV